MFHANHIVSYAGDGFRYDPAPKEFLERAVPCVARAPLPCKAHYLRVPSRCRNNPNHNPRAVPGAASAVAMDRCGVDDCVIWRSFHSAGAVGSSAEKGEKVSGV